MKLIFKLNDIVILKCQRIIRNWLHRKKNSFVNVVLEYKKSPLSQDAKKRHNLWHEIIDTEKSYLGISILIFFSLFKAKLIYVVQVGFQVEIFNKSRNIEFH
jgi:hypothetical protein